MLLLSSLCNLLSRALSPFLMSFTATFSPVALQFPQSLSHWVRYFVSEQVGCTWTQIALDYGAHDHSLRPLAQLFVKVIVVLSLWLCDGGAHPGVGQIDYGSPIARPIPAATTTQEAG